MKEYISPEVEFEKFTAQDVISASGEEPVEPTLPEQGTDPYEGDKW